MKLPNPDIFAGLPAGDMLRQGVTDLLAGETTIPACLAAIASPRLVEAGVLDATHVLGTIDTEHTLYQLLGETEAEPFAAYSAHLDELDSFENALDHRLRWEKGLSA